MRLQSLHNLLEVILIKTFQVTMSMKDSNKNWSRQSFLMLSSIWLHSQLTYCYTAFKKWLVSQWSPLKMSHSENFWLRQFTLIKTPLIDLFTINCLHLRKLSIKNHLMLMKNLITILWKAYQLHPKVHSTARKHKRRPRIIRNLRHGNSVKLRAKLIGI